MYWNLFIAMFLWFDTLKIINQYVNLQQQYPMMTVGNPEVFSSNPGRVFLVQCNMSIDVKFIETMWSHHPLLHIIIYLNTIVIHIVTVCLPCMVIKTVCLLCIMYPRTVTWNIFSGDRVFKYNLNYEWNFSSSTLSKSGAFWAIPQRWPKILIMMNLAN